MNTSLKVNKRTLGLAVIASFAVLFLFVSPTVLTNAYTVKPMTAQGNGNLYVQDYGASEVSVISASTDKVIKTVSFSDPVGQNAYDPVTNTVWVPGGASSGTNVAAINASTNKIVKSVNVKEEEPSGAVWVPGKGAGFIAVSDFGASAVTIINATSYKVIKQITSDFTDPEFLTYVPTTNTVWVSNVGGYSSDAVTIVSVSTWKPIKELFPTGMTYYPRGIVYNTVNGAVYLADEEYGSYYGGVFVLNVTTYKTITIVSTSNYDMYITWGLNTAPNTGYVWAAALDGNSGGDYYGDMNAISTSNKVVATISMGSSTEGPVMGAYSHVNGYIYFTSVDESAVGIINGTKLMTKTISVGSEPQGIIAANSGNM